MRVTQLSILLSTLYRLSREHAGRVAAIPTAMSCLQDLKEGLLKA